MNGFVIFFQLITAYEPVIHLIYLLEEKVEESIFKVVKQYNQKEKKELLETFGNSENPANSSQIAKEFFQTILYSDKKSKIASDTRCWMYEQQKQKSSYWNIQSVYIFKHMYGSSV